MGGCRGRRRSLGGDGVVVMGRRRRTQVRSVYRRGLVVGGECQPSLYELC